MSNLTARIKTLEKKILPEPVSEPIEFHTFWEEDGKLFYVDYYGNEQEYVKKEDRYPGKDVITGFILPKDLAKMSKDYRPPITNL